MDFKISLNKLKNSNYFSNIFIMIFILLSFLLLFSLIFVFIFDFDTSLSGLDNHSQDNSTIPMGMYLVKTIDMLAPSPVYYISVSYFAIFTFVCFGLSLILLISYYPIFKNKTIVLNMFYIMIANLVSITILLACFPTFAPVEVFFRDPNMPNILQPLFTDNIFVTILFDNWKMILEENNINGVIGFDVLSEADITWFYVMKHIIYVISTFTIIFSSSIIIKELYAGKKFFLDPYIMQLANFNN